MHKAVGEAHQDSEAGGAVTIAQRVNINDSQIAALQERLNASAWSGKAHARVADRP